MGNTGWMAADLNMVVVGDPLSGEESLDLLKANIRARLMAEWLVEGTLNVLLDPANPTAQALLIAPCCMCRI